MCEGTTPAGPATFVPVDVDWSGQQIRLEPVDEVQVLTVCDNTIDIFLLDQGPARRLLSAAGPPPSMLATPTMVEGAVVDGPLAQHGFSALVTVRRGHRSTRSCSTPGSRPTAAWRTCAASARTPPTSRPSSAATATSTTPPACPGSPPRSARQNLPVVDPPGVLDAPSARHPGPGTVGDPDDQPPRARGRRIRRPRAAAAVVPARRGAARHRRGRPHDRLRAGVSDPPGVPRRRLGARPAHPRRPGVDRERRREGAWSC